MGILGQHQKNVPIECLDVFNEELALSGKYVELMFSVLMQVLSGNWQ